MSFVTQTFILSFDETSDCKYYSVFVCVYAVTCMCAVYQRRGSNPGDAGRRSGTRSSADQISTASSVQRFAAAWSALDCSTCRHASVKWNRFFVQYCLWNVAAFVLLRFAAAGSTLMQLQSACGHVSIFLCSIVFWCGSLKLSTM
jgi:hypothetical protein